jgi:hypothetical protein
MFILFGRRRIVDTDQKMILRGIRDPDGICDPAQDPGAGVTAFTGVGVTQNTCMGPRKGKLREKFEEFTSEVISCLGPGDTVADHTQYGLPSGKIFCLGGFEGPQDFKF